MYIYNTKKLHKKFKIPFVNKFMNKLSDKFKLEFKKSKNEFIVKLF